MTANFARHLRRELAVCATRYAQDNGIPYYCSLGAPPVVLFHRYGDGAARHGNFLDRSFAAICGRPEWAERLSKSHPTPKALPPDRREGACELNSSTSSDALLMNIFCHPDSAASQPLAQLFGLARLPDPRFGVKGGASLRGTSDTTEIDMVLDTVHVEAKLTEAGFTEKDLDHVRAYDRFEQEFDAAPMMQRDRTGQPIGKVRHYQLIRNVLAIADYPEKRFVLLIDERRPDLHDAWTEVAAAIKDPAVRARCGAVRWQQVAAAAPAEVRAFLRVKFGIG